MKWIRWAQVAAGVSILIAADVASASKPYVLVTGRRDPRIYSIDFNAALNPANNNTPNAIVSRSKVNPTRLDGKELGDSANIVLSDDHKTAYVMNHHGAVVNAEFLQHGGRANVAIMDVHKMLNPVNDDTTNALLKNVDTGWFGGVGLLVTSGMIVASHSEGWLTEDGSNRISFVDPQTGGLRHQIEMALVGPGVRQLRTGCTAFPVPFVSPTQPPQIPAGEGFLSPDAAFGCWPDPQFIAIGNGSDGKQYLISGNGGTDDVSIMDLGAALAGQKVVEVAPRIPIQTGSFGIAASPDGKLIAVTGRESHQIAFEGNTISIIDVDLARQGLPGAEAARVQVGTDNPSTAVRPFTVAWTPDGSKIVVAGYRTNVVSVVDVQLALAHDPGAEVARIPMVRADGLASRPKGVAVTPDGHYAVVSGGPNTITASATNLTGTVYIVDLTTNTQVATITNVGIDPYGVAIVGGHVDGD